MCDRFKKAFWACLCTAALSACGGNSTSTLWNDIPVVAKQTGELIELDPTLLKDTIVIPLSSLLEEIHVVKLDHRDEALVNPMQTRTIISDNYILLANMTDRLYKLFDRKGNFVTDIGSIGNGPGQYNMVAYVQMDESQQKIYLLPFNTDEILVYDLKGKALSSIPLPERIRKGIFSVRKNKVTVAIPPLRGVKNITWVQTTGGELLYYTPRDTLDNGSVNNIDIYSYRNNPETDVSYWYIPSRRDSLYHMDADGNLTPRFTTRFEGKALKPHHYAEWPGYFVGSTNSIIYYSDGTKTWTEGEAPDFYIVDKQTLKGGFLHLYNDLFDKQENYPVYIFSNGYYIMSDEPGNLQEMMGRVLQTGRLPEKYRSKWMQILNEMDPDDNNYIFYAKLKR